MASVRGEDPKSPKIGFLKMSRKRVFRKNPIVQGPGFSCKPNIAFFMGYPLYRGVGEDHKPPSIILMLFRIILGT